jgi:hypothetical protein
LSIEAVDASASDNVWAVGEISDNDDTTRITTGVVLHWDGSNWRALDDPAIANPYGLNPRGDVTVYYTSISAVNRETAWVGGYSLLPGGVAIPLTILATTPESLMPIPPPALDAGIYDIAAVDSTSAWAVGATSDSTTAPKRTVIERVECG